MVPYAFPPFRRPALDTAPTHKSPIFDEPIDHGRCRIVLCGPAPHHEDAPPVMDQYTLNDRFRTDSLP